MGEVCECRCHGGKPVQLGNLCCPECDEAAYDACQACGQHRYQHNDEERKGSPGACGSFVGDDAERERAHQQALGAAGQQRLFVAEQPV